MTWLENWSYEVNDMNANSDPIVLFVWENVRQQSQRTVNPR